MRIVKAIMSTLGDNFWLLLAALCMLLIAVNQPANAGEVTPAAAEQFCRENIEHNAGEAAIDIQISGPTWRSSWGENIHGDTITLTFANDAIVLQDRTSTMADHVLTIQKRQLAGTGVLVARYQDNGATVALLVLPTVVSLAGNTPGCFQEWLIR